MIMMPFSICIYSDLLSFLMRKKNSKYVNRNIFVSNENNFFLLTIMYFCIIFSNNYLYRKWIELLKKSLPSFVAGFILSGLSVHVVFLPFFTQQKMVFEKIQMNV